MTCANITTQLALLQDSSLGTGDGAKRLMCMVTAGLQQVRFDRLLGVSRRIVGQGVLSQCFQLTDMCLHHAAIA